MVYDAPETVNGLIHVFYIGENPKTHEPDSILMASLAIVEGEIQSIFRYNNGWMLLM